MAESILVTGKKISSMELVTNVTGNEKIPTGQPNDLAVTPNQIADHTITRGDLASQEDLSQVEVSLGTQITDLANDVASADNSIRGLITAEEVARIAADNLKVDKEGSVSSVAGRVGDVVLTPSDVLVGGFGSQEEVNKYIPKPFLSGYVYGLGDYVVLDNSDVVESVVDGNANNPNTNMTGWVLKPNKTTAANVADASGETQQQVNYNGGSKWHSRVGGYQEDERVVLANGGIVKSTVAGNLNNPNVSMTGWVRTDSVSQVFDESGLSQQEVNDDLVMAISDRYKKSEVDSFLDTKADKVDTYTREESDALLLLKTDKTYVDDAIGAISTDANKQYATLDLANADIANISVNENVFISESVNGGYWYKAAVDATTLTRSAYDPLAQAKNYVDEKTGFISSSNYAFSIDDSAGNTALAVKESGYTEVVGLDISETTVEESDEYAWSVKDSNGNVSFAVGNDGTVYAANIVTNGIDPDGSGIKESEPYANIMHIECFSQSLGLGAYALPPLSTVQNYGNLMFQGGISNQHPQNSSIAFRGAFVPLKEGLTDDGWYPIGETPLTPSTDMIRQLLSVEDGIEYTDQDLRFLGTASGEGGMNITHLATVEYPTNLKPNISAAYNLAQAQNKTYAMPAMLWVHGESDNNASQTIANYKTSAKALFSSINDYAKSVNNQAETVQVISTQLANPKYGNLTQPKIELALYELANELDYFHLACPLYIFDYVDNAHLDNVSSRIMGGYLGLVYKRVVFDKKGWSHIKPISHRVQGKIAEVKFHVPVKPLVFDTDRVTLNTNYGFSLVDASGNAITISSVTLSQEDTVKVIATSNIPVGAKLRYAFSPVDGLGRVNGTRGNLRDSQGDEIKFHDFAMHNWTPIFEYTLS